MANFDLISLVNNDGCFDLQFRKDTKHGRTNSPTYYRWKAQFVVTGPKDSQKALESVQKALGCGKVHIVGSQARFSVQSLEDLNNAIIPYFKQNQLSGNKKKDFNLWQKGVGLIYKNKGVYLAKWSKNDLQEMIDIQKAGTQFKSKSRQPKWLEMAQILSQKL